MVVNNLEEYKEIGRRGTKTSGRFVLQRMLTNKRKKDDTACKIRTKNIGRAPVKHPMLYIMELAGQLLRFDTSMRRNGFGKLEKF